jgi:hypothetical protein
MTTYRSLLGAAALGIGVAAFGFGATQEAGAATFDFVVFQGPAGNFSGEVEVLLSGSTLTTRISNTSPSGDRPVITDVYFQSGWANYVSNPVLDVNNVGIVNFTPPATPPNLPGWNGLGFTSTFSADATNPQPENGINPNETLGISWTFTGTEASFAQLLSEIQQGPSRIGAQVADCQGSASCQAMTVPVPAALPLLLTALGALGVIGRKKMKAAATA